MNNKTMIRVGLLGVLVGVLGLRSASVFSDPVFTAGNPPSIAQAPLYMEDAVPPLNMLVMGKDHKNYYEAYNDASDLNGDGVLDVGYKPALDYYGYYNSRACYNWDEGSGGRFVPAGAAPNKTCTGQWSGDFLNYVTTSRMDALRRVLYGGWRNVDTTTQTILQGAYFPQDAHSWGKEYRSIERDEYDIRNYTPLPLPTGGRYHLFAVTTVKGNDNTFPAYQAPLLRVLRDSPYRVWNWLSIEGPVANRRCVNSANQYVTCVSGGTTPAHPGHPANRAEYNTLEANFATPANFYGQGSLNNINCTSSACNPHNSDQNNYLTIIEGKFQVGNGNGNGNDGAGWYQFSVDGDDAVDFEIRRGTTVLPGGQAGYYGGHDVCNCNSYSTGGIYLERGEELSIKFRHEDAGGGDQYILRYRSASTQEGLAQKSYVVVPGGNGNGQTGLRNTTITTYDLTPVTGGTSRTDYLVRVEACPATEALRDATCKLYPGGSYKPTGILHDFGESQRMYFGLITGSQRNNLEGGVLRSNVGNFAREVDASSGIFNANFEGIVRSIDRLRMIGGAYNSGNDNTNQDSNWNWDNGSANCLSQGNRAQDNGECRMWGNPIAEMLYESLRYFAGARSATPRFTTNGSTAGNEDAVLGLPTPDWTNPYGNTTGDQNYPSCARPYQTVISDINPSYDGDLPGSGFAGALQTVGTTPTSIGSFSASGEGQTVWNEEGLGASRQVFVGEVGGATDGAPTAKSASSFGNIRGLSPEEPTKAGTYYSASVARFGRRNDINSAPEPQNLSTYSIALASPLPRIEFPVNGKTLTLLPFAKTVSGTYGDGTRKPTNTIVDFYVEEYENFGPQAPPPDAVNGGRPRAVFRINYEDVEQGNDHDMDAIVRYEVVANANNTVSVNLTSEYAAGSANHAIGYTMTGSTQDGIYLEVCDLLDQRANDGSRASCAHQSDYRFNTPPGRAPGYCDRSGAPADCRGLPPTTARVFAPSSSTGAQAFQLKNPLWYAAKYGTPEASQADWDKDGDGDPDNYFLVTNPLELRQQLTDAFDDIAERDLDVGNSAISGARVQAASFTLQPTFARKRQGKDWVGDLSAIAITPNGTLAPGSIWNAASELAPTGPVTHLVRNIRTIVSPVDGTYPARRVARLSDADADFGATPADRLGRLGINSTPSDIASRYGGVYTSADFINYLRGDQSKEATREGGGTLRLRSSVLGDIVNSEPVIVSGRNDFGYGNYADSMFFGYANQGSSGYLFDKRNRKTVVYVGANDGMLHAFDGSTVPCTLPGPPPVQISCETGTSGQELFAFIPNGVLDRMGQLPLPDNNFNHRYYVDGQIVVGDARRNDNAWRSILVGTTGAGGRSIFALDVTDIETRSSFINDNVLWERNQKVDLDIGHIYGKPLLVPLENNRWGVVFGNGYGGNLSDPSLYILDAFTGELIKKITANDGNRARAPNLIGVITGIINGFVCTVTTLVGGECAQASDPFNGLGQITAIDRNGNGKVDTVYGGDQQGNLWKFDLRGNAATAWDVYTFENGTKAPLFTAETGSGLLAERQPISGGIRIAAGPGTGVMVYFGTGRYFVNGDNDVGAPPQVQTLYAVYDNGPLTGNGGSTPAGRRADLVAQTVVQETTANGFTTRNISRNPVAYFGTGAKRGWYLDLRVDAALPNGERFIATPRIQSGRVFFTTYRPEENSCSPGGTNFQYGLDLLSGAGALADIAVLPSGRAACTDDACGGVAIRGSDGSATQPPITNTSVAAITPVRKISTTCNPAVESCATFEECQVVIYPGAFVLPRPCGRQSWRQLK